MALPTNINNIINKNVVEQVRVECKKGWNPEDIIHTISAFANDIDNFGGGYVIIGAEFGSDSDGYTFYDLPKQTIDEIQQKTTELCLKCIKPEYVPVSDVMEYDGKRFVVVWAYAGPDRAYKCLEKINDVKSRSAYYVRKGSSTIKAVGNIEKELLMLSQREPFDERINHQATLDDISIDLINEYIRKTNSDLQKIDNRTDKLSLCRDLRIIGGPNEDIHPRNIGLLMFSNNPEKYIPYSYIDLVIIKDQTGRDIIERRFSGSLLSQYESAMLFFENNVLDKKIVKNSESGLSKMYYNYPLDAFDEILSNALLHKDYRENNPISIRVESTFISITSYPGFESGIKDKDIFSYNIKSDRYRNRRIAEFLKELHIVEAHNTGFPTALEACDENDSDYPIFISDDDRTFLTVKLPINKRFLSSKDLDRRDLLTEITEILKNGSFTLSQLSKALGYNQIPGALKRNIKILIANGTVIANPNKTYSLK